jgi:hypothetical protein
MAGPGLSEKAATYDLNPDTIDWVHQYSFWAASSVWKQYLVTGDLDFAVGQLDNLVQYYAGYDNHFNKTLGLYWQAPVWDASEYTAASYETDPADPYHGGYGYRPTINSYQFGDAAAISALAALAGDANLAQEYENKSKAIENATQALLWDSNDHFFKHRARDNNPEGSLLDTREIMGYLPWMFNMSLKSDHAQSFTQLMDASGFASTYGPTTTEKRSSWYMHDAAQGCCRWTGPAWPFATSQTLTAVENLLHDYPAQSYITSSDYFTLISQYAAMHSKNGQPYVAEAHWPDQDAWIYDTEGHSEDYNHSTFVDNILTGLLGLRPRPGRGMVVNPLVPTSWSYFGLENVAYHGHNVTILWDRDGTHYGQGSGLRVWVDDVSTGSRSDLGPLTVPLKSDRPKTARSEINIAVNSLRDSIGTQPTASFTSAFGGDDVWHGIDGTIFRVGIPENTRWTTYESPNKTDWYAITFTGPQTLTEVDLYFYDDAGGVRLPASFDLQYLHGTSWSTVPSQTLRGELQANSQAQITFPSITSTALRVVAPNGRDGVGWGLSEFQVWTGPV